MIATKTGPLEVGRFVKASLAHAAGLAKQGKLEEALQVSEALHKQYPDRADVNDGLALALLDMKRVSEAVIYATRAVELEPGSTAYQVNLGLLHLDSGKVEDALPLLEKAARRKDCPMEALWALARYFFDVGKADASFPYFEKAIAAADADNLQLIRFDYLRSLSAGGQIERADELVRQLRENPRLGPQAIVYEASLRKHTSSSPIVDELRQIVESPMVPDQVKSQALLQIGRACDSSGLYDEAFSCYRKSKSLRNLAFDVGAFEAYVDKLISTYTPELFRRFGNIGHDTDVPLFVVGMPRSGTTLTEQILGAHPDAAGVGEQTRMGAFAKRLSPESDPGRIVLALENASPQSWKQLGAAYLRLARHLEPQGRKLVDKLPQNFLHLGMIALCFPNAKFVHVHRNPLDNFLSAYENHMSDYHRYSFDQVAYGKYYLLYRKLMDHWHAVLPDRIFNWDYERLAVAPEERVPALLAFADLPWSDECLRFHEKKTTVKTFSMHQVRNPISAKSVGRWRNYATHLEPIRQVLGI